MRTLWFCTLILVLAVHARADARPAKRPTPTKPAKDDKSGPTNEQKAEAKALADEATKQFNVQQYEKAAELYAQAYVIDPKPGYLYATAQSQRLGGACEKALLSYDAYLRTNPAEAERAKTEANIERCRQDINDREAAVQASQVAPPPEVPATPEAPPPPPPVEPSPPPPQGKSYIIGHLLLGTGVIAVAGGIFLFRDGHQTITEHNEAATYQDFLDGRADMDQAKQRQMLGVIGISAGAALVAGGILYYVIHARSSDEESPVSATVTAHQASVWFRRSF